MSKFPLIEARKEINCAIESFIGVERAIYTKPGDFLMMEEHMKNGYKHLKAARALIDQLQNNDMRDYAGSKKGLQSKG